MSVCGLHNTAFKSRIVSVDFKDFHNFLLGKLDAENCIYYKYGINSALNLDPMYVCMYGYMYFFNICNIYIYIIFFKNFVHVESVIKLFQLYKIVCALGIHA